MLSTSEKIIFYLTFAKSKLYLKCEKHRKAKEEIDELINKLKESENKWIDEER